MTEQWKKLAKKSSECLLFELKLYIIVYFSCSKACLVSAQRKRSKIPLYCVCGVLPTFYQSLLIYSLPAGPIDVPLTGRCYQYYSHRLSSFRQWPVDHPVSAITLAQNGFFYLGNSGRGDEAVEDRSDDCVMCPFCSSKRSGWQCWDDVREIHRQLAPDCPFLSSPQVNGTNNEVFQSYLSILSNQARPARHPANRPSSIPLSRPQTSYQNYQFDIPRRRPDAFNSMFFNLLAAWRLFDMRPIGLQPTAGVFNSITGMQFREVVSYHYMTYDQLQNILSIGRQPQRIETIFIGAFILVLFCTN